MVEAGTLCTQPDVEKKAGAFANATAVAEAYTNVLILEAEGAICTACRYDLVTNYASLTAIAKEYLRDLASSYTAVMVMQYDMTGLKTEEAMSIVNINWAIFMAGIKRLEQDNYREFLGVEE